MLLKGNPKSIMYFMICYIDFPSGKDNFKLVNSDFQLGSTRLTENIEDSDPDELCRLGSIVETANIENSDPDEFYLC